jgi:hypothetical protein
LSCCGAKETDDGTAVGEVVNVDDAAVHNEGVVNDLTNIGNVGGDEPRGCVLERQHIIYEALGNEFFIVRSEFTNHVAVLSMGVVKLLHTNDAVVVGIPDFELNGIGLGAKRFTFKGELRRDESSLDFGDDHWPSSLLFWHSHQVTGVTGVADGTAVGGSCPFA